MIMRDVPGEVLIACSLYQQGSLDGEADQILDILTGLQVGVELGEVVSV